MSILPSLLFNIHIEYIMQIVLDDCNEGISVEEQVIKVLKYVDATTLLVNSEEDINVLLRHPEMTSFGFRLTINGEMTKL